MSRGGGWSYDSKADSEPAHQARAPLFENLVGFVFVNFDCGTRIYFNCIVNMQCVQYVFYYIPNYNNIGYMCEGAPIHSPDPKNSTVLGPRPTF